MARIFIYNLALVNPVEVSVVGTPGGLRMIVFVLGLGNYIGGFRAKGAA
jgi:hypothetical protein